ncbi:hypothetical protein Poli38472_012516 [Pythium oligandrum]|uniref:protein-ribulosamine 3-kinase n=1 Tax=Pythium oligandrum TaxID=41045 RepID=A0A8K1CEH3_PYTOL|nr:hypothetical protein Poli38472_012516 [Pythium oligandrum]|eukprot:TMW61325.1 hypothetical protein Poli38472_012516 [Pythium oligandrum]
MDFVPGIVAHVYGVAPRRVLREHGGSINECFIVDLESTGESSKVPERVFIKVNDDEAMFRAEAVGLEALRATQATRVPEVYRVGSAGNAAFLLMEYIPMTTSRESYDTLGVALARLHIHKAPSEKFGFSTDNFIGLTPQKNAWNSDWVAFYRQRLQSQVDMIRERGECSSEGFLQRVQTVIERLDVFFDEDETIGPSLLHGDLWQGNWGFTTQSGEAVLFDPAAYYGHHEADLAMMTLFGDVPEEFYDAYFAIVPKAKRYADRVPLYQLYHALNHFNLFGSAYQGMCDGLMKPLLRQISES